MTSYAERYFYPGTDLTSARQRQPIQDGVEFTPEGLRKVHRHIFQDVYPWAGEFRAVDMVKLQGPGKPLVRFAPGAYVERVEIPRFFGELRHDMEVARSFDGLDPKTFSYRAAVYMADLNHIHPFPEGNGRTQRILLEQMAGRVGYRFNHASVAPVAWLEASIDSYGQDVLGRRGRRARFGRHEKMAVLIEAAIEPRSRQGHETR